MTTIKLIEKLKKYPDNAIVHAYEGELECIVILDPITKKELGSIDTHEENGER